jgi:Flp pilus assembly protein TadG
MPSASITCRLLKAARRFPGAHDGNIAVIFAIALLPLLSFVGVAIDYSRASMARSAMQAAIDSTALMLSKDLQSGNITASQINTQAQAYFTGLYTNKEAHNVAINATYTASSGSMGSTIQIDGSGLIMTDFMKVAGFPTLNFGTSGTSAWGNVRMRVAMALDNTGSMLNDGKMPALQSAAKSLIDQLSALAKTDGDMYISLVPFAKDVNVGASNYTQSWIDWTSWEAEAPDLVGPSKKPSNWSSIGPGSACPWTMSGNGFTCVNGPGSTTAVTTIPNSGVNKGLICPGAKATSTRYKYPYLINGCYTSVLSGATYTHIWTPNPHSMWSGCVTDRTQAYDTQNIAPTGGNVATLFPAEQYYQNSTSYCVTSSNPQLQPIIPLSYDWTALRTAITSMQPTGNTNQAIGMAWAWQSLASTLPLNAPAKDPSYTYKDAIILLSDGLNTEDRWYSSASQIDARQKLVCDNAKAAGVTVYTIQLNTSSPPDATSAVLQDCASSPQNFFLVTSANQTLSVFNSIGTSLAKLRVAK